MGRELWGQLSGWLLMWLCEIFLILTIFDHWYWVCEWLSSKHLFDEGETVDAGHFLSQQPKRKPCCCLFFRVLLSMHSEREECYARSHPQGSSERWHHCSGPRCPHWWNTRPLKSLPFVQVICHHLVLCAQKRSHHCILGTKSYNLNLHICSKIRSFRKWRKVTEEYWAKEEENQVGSTAKWKSNLRTKQKEVERAPRRERGKGSNYRGGPSSSSWLKIFKCLQHRASSTQSERPKFCFQISKKSSSV